MKQLESRGLVRREVDTGPPVRVHYRLTSMGRALAPTVDELHVWARNWLVTSGQGVESETVLNWPAGRSARRRSII